MSTGERRGVLHGLTALRTTKYGKLFQVDTWDLLCNLALSLRPRSRRQMILKVIPDCFPGNEAITSLSSLTFVRSPDSRDLANLVPQSIVTLKLSAEDAKLLMQNFIEAALIASATEENMPAFTTGALYQFTFKGLRAIEEFIVANGIESEADHLVAVLSTLPMPRPKVWRFLRLLSSQDEIVISQSIVTNLFRHFAGESPNYAIGHSTGVRLVHPAARNSALDGLFLNGSRALDGKVSSLITTHCFKVSQMIYWLCRCTSINGHAEAVEMGAHFVRFGLVTLVKDSAKNRGPPKVIVVNGPASSLNPLVTEEGSFLFSLNATYAITDEGRRVALWTKPVYRSRGSQSTDQSPINPAQQLYNDIFLKPFDEKSINATRLRTFIKQPRMRTHFREFLQEESCDFYLSFWLNVEDFRTECKKAFAVSPSRRSIVPDIPVAESSRMAMEMEEYLPAESNHHEAFSEIPFLIYNVYLASSSNCGLRFAIGDDILKEAQVSLEDILESLTNKALVADVEPAESHALDVGQLQVLLELYGRIQSRVFRILTLEYVPRFIKSPRFLAARLDVVDESNSR